MPKRKSTIRKMRGYPTARKYHHLLLELSSISRRLESFAVEIEDLEMWANAAQKIKKADKGK